MLAKWSRGKEKNDMASRVLSAAILALRIFSLGVRRLCSMLAKYSCGSEKNDMAPTMVGVCVGL